MKRQPIEIYGYGTRVPTRSFHLSRLARIVILAAVAGVLVAVSVQW